MAGKAGQYFVRRRGRIMGPFDVTQLERMLRRGNVSRGDACSADRRNWTRLEDLEELFPKEIVVEEEPIDEELTLIEEDAPQVQPVTGEWYYHYQGNENGPVSEDEIRRLLAEGMLSASDSGWKEGMPDWQPLGNLFPMSQGMPPAAPTTGIPTGGIHITVGAPIEQAPVGPQGPQGQGPWGPQGPQGSAPSGEVATAGLIMCGYLFAFLIPIVGVILGIVTCVKGSVGHGAAHILISLVWGAAFAMLMEGARIGSVLDVVSSVLC